jgi:hypothetical protein
MHSHDNGRNKLRKLVAGALPARPRLPLVHSTDAYVFDEVITSGQIEPQSCNVFVGESLIYTFYGRPSFRPNMSELATTMEHYLPVCLIFRQSFSKEIRRVFPFDTGAFVNDFYESYLHKKMVLGDFALEPDLETPGRVISTFFGTPRSYLQARPASPMELDPNQFEARSYAALIDAKDSNAMDSRGSGIEVQIADAVSVADWVEAAIVPSTFADSVIGKELHRLKIEILPYDVHGRMRPNEYFSSISDICIHYYAKKGILEDIEGKNA